MKAFLSFIFIIAGVFSSFAVDVQIDSIVTKPADCSNDGSITVYLGGTDAPYLQSVIYSAGSRSSSLNTIPGLSPGVYTVTVSAWLGNTPVSLSGTAAVGGTASYISLNTQITGIREAMPSLPSGKVKLNISDGKLPYTIEVWKGGMLIASQTFTQPQPEYTVEDIPSGEYTLKVTDGCTNSYIAVSIPTINPFDCDYISISQGNRQPDLISITMLPFYNINEYYEEHRSGKKVWWEYSFSYDGGAFTPWSDMPADGRIYHNSALRYCDIWGKEYNVRVRVKGGSGNIICQNSFTVTKPTVSYEQYISLYPETGCVKDTFIVFNTHGGFYDEPLSLTVTNLSDNTILFSGNYAHNTLIKVTNDMIGDTLAAVFTDGKGCVFQKKNALHADYFNYWQGICSSSPCNRDFVGIHFGHYNVVKESIAFSHSPPSGTVVELIEAPDPQLFFKAVYDRANDTWTNNTSGRQDVVMSNNRVGLTDTSSDLTDTTLPSGWYSFHISDGCGYDEVFRFNVDFYQYRTIQPLQIKGSQLTCDGVAYFPTNKVERYRYTVSGYDPAEPVETYFEVLSIDGGTANIVGGRTVNQGSIVINPQYNGQSHTFIATDYYSNDYCPISRQSFSYDKPPAISIKETAGYRCPGADAVIMIAADSTTGIQPYKFTLYSHTGSEIDSNTTGIFRINTAENNFTVKLTDGCNMSDAAYTESFRSVSLLNIGIDRMIAGKEYICLGEKDSLICRFNAGNYEWTRPGGGIETGRTIHISYEDENKLETGWYRLKITGLDCEAQDSIYVDVERPFNDTIFLAPICDTELPFEHKGIVFYEEGFQSVYDISVNGCDSTTTYHLAVHPAYDIQEKEIICAADLPYIYADTTFNTDTRTGIYIFNKQTVHGCDSIVTLELIVGDIKETMFTDTIFKYEDYHKHNFSLSPQIATGDFTHSQHLSTTYGCDSTVTLYLTVNPIVKGRIETYNPEVCGDDEYFSFKFLIEEGAADMYSIRFSDKEHRAGFADYQVYAPDQNSVEVLLPKDIRPDHYSLEIIFENIYGYTDTHTVEFTILYPSSIILQMWNDVLALKNSGNNGGYNFTAYQWYKNGHALPGEKESYLYTGPENTLDLNAEYRVEITRTDDGATLLTCPVIPVVHHEISVYPTLISSSQYITVRAASAGRSVLWSLSGTKISEQQLKEGNNEILSPGSPGTYLLDIDLHNGIKTKHLIVVK